MTHIPLSTYDRGEALETAAHAEGDGWHSIGRQIPKGASAQETLEVAGLNWTVSKRPVYTMDNTANTHVIPGKFALVRDTDNHPYDVVGKDWRPVQNAKVAEFFEGFVKEGKLVPHAAGSTFKGQHVFFVCKINRTFTLFGKDVTEGLICFTNPHKLGAAIGVKQMGNRLFCANQIDTGGLGHSRWTHVAREGFDVAVAQKLLTLSDQKFAEYEQQAKVIAGRKASPGQLIEYFKRVFNLLPPPADTPKEEADKIHARNEVMLERVFETHDDQPGIEYGQGTWWHATNTVTYLVDHVTGRGSPEKRFHSAQFGQGSERKRQALTLALEYAA